MTSDLFNEWGRWVLFVCLGGGGDLIKLQGQASVAREGCIDAALRHDVVDPRVTTVDLLAIIRPKLLQFVISGHIEFILGFVKNWKVHV